jgi:hypothetical protein
VAAATTGNMSAQNADAVAITGGSVSDTSITVADNVFTLQDNVDPTKQAQFQLSGLSTGVTRTFTFPNGDTTLAGISTTQTFTGGNTFSNSGNSFGTSPLASTTNIGSGATTTGLTKTVNVGTGGLSGSTTNITVGAVAGTSTTTMNGQTDIGGTTTSVNFARIVGAATGAAPTISAQGSDANINLGLTAKGTGNINLSNGSGLQVQINDSVGTAVNYFSFGGSVTNSTPAMVMKGSDANVGAALTTKGTGGYVFWSGNFSRINAVIPSVASSVNFLQLAPAVTTGAPELSAQGSDANINLKLTPKGTGTLQFGTYTAGVLSPTGFITITDAAGTSRRLLVG